MVLPNLAGDGVMELDRCPNHYVEPWVHDLVMAWGMVKKHKIWPVHGGLDDQAAGFVDAVHFLDGEAARYQKEDLEKR